MGAYASPVSAPSPSQLKHVSAALSSAKEGVSVSLEGGSSEQLHRAEQVGYALRVGTAAALPSEKGVAMETVHAAEGEAVPSSAGPHPLLEMEAEARTAHLQVRVCSLI